MPDRDGPGHRVVTGKQQRQCPPLGMHLVHGLQPAGKRLLLSRALALEAGDLAAQRSDVGLRLLDASVQPGDVPLLVGQALLDAVELRQDPRPLLARLGGLAPLLLELLLGLAQLSLLGLDGVVLLRDLGDGRLGGERHEREAGEDARPHASGRPRASQPPMPPSSVPASISEITLCGRRKVSRATPSVSLTSGSMRGPMSAWHATRTQIASMAPS